MSFDVRTFSIVSPVHVESVQQIIVAMGCYVNRTGVRLHDIYKLNTNTARKGEDHGSVSLQVCLSVSLSLCTNSRDRRIKVSMLKSGFRSN